MKLAERNKLLAECRELVGQILRIPLREFEQTDYAMEDLVLVRDHLKTIIRNHAKRTKGEA